MGIKFLSRQEELLLLVIRRLRENAYGVTIRQLTVDLTSKHWSIGAIYDILDRLVRKGYLDTIVGSPTEKRGGKRKRFYRITNEGFGALEEVRHLNETMWGNLPGTVKEEA